MRWEIKIKSDHIQIDGIGLEESGAIIYQNDDNTFALYEYQYGGSEMYSGSYSSLYDAMIEAESWTWTKN